MRLINENSTVNLFKSAFESGHRLARREANMNAAFTYGRSVKFDDLDMPFKLFKRIIKEDLKEKNKTSE